MKHLAVSIAILLSCAAPRAQSPDESLRRQLTDFLTAASHAPASAADKRVFDLFFADDVVYTRASGVVIGKPDIMKSLDVPARGGDPTSTYTGEDIQVRRPLGTSGVVIITFRLVQQLSSGTVNRYRNTGTFVLRAGRWQAVAWQATPIAQ